MKRIEGNDASESLRYSLRCCAYYTTRVHGKWPVGTKVRVRRKAGQPLEIEFPDGKSILFHGFAYGIESAFLDQALILAG